MLNLGRVPTAARWLGLLSLPDVDRAAAYVRSHGGEVIQPPTTIPGRGRHAVFRDAQGAVFGVLASSDGDPPDDPVLKTYEGVLPGMTVGLQLPEHMAAWIADLRAKGYDLPRGRQEVYRPVAGYPGAEGRGHSFAPPIFSAARSSRVIWVQLAPASSERYRPAPRALP